MGFRKIIVDGEEYSWHYVYDDSDYQCKSLLVFKHAGRKKKWVIGFRGASQMDIGYCPFNKGLPAENNGEDVVINLNQPRFAAEILSAVLSGEYEAKCQGQYDGIQILRGLGYEFDYRLTAFNNI